MIKLNTYLIISPDTSVECDTNHPMTYGPRPSPISATKILRIPASLYIAICSGLGRAPAPAPAPGGGPLILIMDICSKYATLNNGKIRGQLGKSWSCTYIFDLGHTVNGHVTSQSSQRVHT
jgi:hypothetical protein